MILFPNSDSNVFRSHLTIILADLAIVFRLLLLLLCNSLTLHLMLLCQTCLRHLTIMLTLLGENFVNRLELSLLLFYPRLTDPVLYLHHPKEISQSSGLAKFDMYLQIHQNKGELLMCTNSCINGYFIRLLILLEGQPFVMLRSGSKLRSLL